MTISTWLIILAFAVGPGTSQSIESDSSTTPTSTRTGAKIASNCWINGVWYNPCPTENPPPYPDKSPEILIQY